MPKNILAEMGSQVGLTPARQNKKVNFFYIISTNCFDIFYFIIPTYLLNVLNNLYFNYKINIIYFQYVIRNEKRYKYFDHKVNYSFL